MLDLPPDATQEEVKRAYRELAKVWHPDRFTGDPKLQQKAQEKLKQINSAYERICKSGGHERRSAGPTRGEPSPGSRASTDANERKDSTADRGEGREQAPRQPPPPPPPPQPPPAPATNWWRRVLQFVIAIVVLSVIRGIFTSSDRSPRQTSDYRPSHSAPSRSYFPEPPAAQQPPKSRQRLTLQQIMDLHGAALKRRPDLGMSIQEFSRWMQANQADYDFSEGIAYLPPPIAPQPAPVPPQVASAPVLQQRVAHDEPASPPGQTDLASRTQMEQKVEVARVKAPDTILPTPSSPRRGYFTVGSTKDQVLAVQGTPDQVSDSTFTYGYSRVVFNQERVVSWYQARTDPLKVKLLPTSPVAEKDYFTVGSTKDQVLAVQGTPDEVSDSTFTYGYSRVVFNQGRVESWYQARTDPLKVK